MIAAGDRTNVLSMMEWRLFHFRLRPRCPGGIHPRTKAREMLGLTLCTCLSHHTSFIVYVQQRAAEIKKESRDNERGAPRLGLLQNNYARESRAPRGAVSVIGHLLIDEEVTTRSIDASNENGRRDVDAPNAMRSTSRPPHVRATQRGGRQQALPTGRTTSLQYNNNDRIKMPSKDVNTPAQADVEHSC